MRNYEEQRFYMSGMHMHIMEKYMKVYIGLENQD